MNVIEKLAAYSEVMPNGCREWRRATNSSGYPQVCFNGKNHLAHRIAYELHVGPLLDDMTIDHLCRNKICVEPSHLELVTLAENVQRQGRRDATHCKRGHEYTDANTIIKPRPNGRFIRNCRTCQRASGRASYVKSAYFGVAS